MRRILFFLITVVFFSASACKEAHLISNKTYRQRVESAFAERQQLASGRKEQLFSVFNRKLNTSQVEALEFLFAFMPLSDLADYKGEFFLDNANIALITRKESLWGDKIPEEIFLHYVLPCRVNNENLDSFRIIFRNEIFERIKGLGMGDAALEINHWCHEKVAYQPSDIRTSGPVSTILSARGRCGEESTFTVSALRTAGIPARQVYTPRWAHTDDNHAWVEVWIDGKWHYMGACEPEPVLDLGWFTEPARRAMLIHTKSFGGWYGNENEINRYRNYSVINNLANYALTKRIYVKVIDEQELPVKDAIVEYQLYNYAEFYPLAAVSTNENGISSFETGLGDLLIWARKGDSFNYRKISVPETDTLILKIRSSAKGTWSEDLDLNVPPVLTAFEGPPQDLVEKNEKRLKSENDLRQEYIDSWIKHEDAEAFARLLNIDPVLTGNIIARSMGNYKTIVSFLKHTHANDRELALSLLNILSEKDLRDIREHVLSDQLANVRNPFKINVKEELFVNYVLNPRVSNEMLVGFREYLIKALPEELKTDAIKDPQLIISFINNSVRISEEENYYETPLSPIGVNELKVTDSKSRAIYFVAICRCLGIPSRLEPGSNIPQYFFDSKWNDVWFNDEKVKVEEKGYLKLLSSETNPVPEYYIHFTVARFENGRYNTLEYDFSKKITDFSNELILAPGHYLIVTGNRISDSKILSNISFFDLSPGQHLSAEIKLRKDIPDNEIKGAINLARLRDLITVNDRPNTIDFSKGVLLAWIDPEKEPSKHFLNDLPGLKTEFDAWGGNFIFLIADSLNSNYISNLHEFSDLPSIITSVNIKNINALDKIWISGTKPDLSYPLIILSDKDGNVLFRSSGYRIGIAEQILKTLRRL
jgi:transglutaminase-like putative cysteine protease